MRELASRRYQEFERELCPLLTRFAVEETVRRFQNAGDLHGLDGEDRDRWEEETTGELVREYGAALAKSLAPEDVVRLSRDIARRLHGLDALGDPANSLILKERFPQAVWTWTAELLGAERKTFAGEVLRALQCRRLELWHERVKRINWELYDRGVETFVWLALEEITKAARDADRLRQAPSLPLKEELRQSFASWVFLWQRQSGPKGDLVDDEFGRVLQVPGWTNIFTQPIIARIEMLSSGVRTDIGVKVFGPDLDTIDRVCKDVEGVLKPINGARAVVANPIMGKGYLEIDIDLAKAARYGVRVEDIKNTVEVALGGQAVTQTVEGRERFPVRLRYPRSEREDEETVRRLLVSGGAEFSRDPEGSAGSRAPLRVAAKQDTFSDDSRRPHKTIAEHGGGMMQPLQIPLGSVADVRIVEGPAMMKSENGQLVNYVTLMVQGRDIVGFVEEAQRAVAETVQLPEGVHIEWSGEFEHQVRAARTLRFVFPAVIVLIFVILYLTYKDLADAGLMMLAVPEALAGGAFFQFLFPKILHGWTAPPMDFSVAVWVGYIACFGMATETGIIMLVYLREAIEKRGGLENIQSLEELRQAVIEGAVHRLRPKLLTEGVAILAIAPMLWATGVGAEVIAPMAVPVLGGLLISDEVVDIFLPVRFYWVRRRRWLKLHGQDGPNPVSTHRAPMPMPVG